MKTPITLSTNAIFATMLICSALLFTSCSDSNTGNEPIEPENETVEDSPITDSDKITNWNDRKTLDATKAQKSLDNLGWYFLVDASLLSGGDYLHVYAGLDEKNKMTLFAVNSGNDTKKNGLNNLQKLELKTDSTFLNDSLEVVIPKNKDHWISQADAQQRINNWKSKSIRDSWVTQRYQIDSLPASNNPLFSVMVVDVSDFRHLDGANGHACFLSLSDTIINRDTLYSADLIVADYKIDSQVINYVLEDVVHSVPPFGVNSISPLYPSNFGILEKLQLVP